jgi:beta-lactam-binding protein with PASTA domain
VAGPDEFVVVPDVVGAIQQEAHAAVTNAGLRPHTDGFETTPEEAANTVIRQDPPGGSVASPGEVVELTIGAGKPVVPTVPDDHEIEIPIPRDFVEPVSDRSSDDPGVRDADGPRTQRGW